MPLPDELSKIFERIASNQYTDADLEGLRQWLGGSGQSVSQSGKYAVNVGQGQDIHVGDRYTGVTFEEIRLIVQELKSLQSSQPNSSFGATQNIEQGADDPPFRKLVLDPTTLKAINERLDVLEEIERTGYLPATQQPELRKLKQQLQSFNTLTQELQIIAEQSDRLIQEAVAAMRLQVDALKLSGKTLTEEVQSKLSIEELKCQQAETEIFQTFTNRLEDSRAGADWITNSMESLINHATKITLKQFPNLNASEQAIDDFRFSLKQFLEQVSFSLYWGTYGILDSPEIPLIFDVEQYETAFQAMKGRISKQLRSETIQEIEACLNYLIERLRFF
jgi:Effector-associated domain 10